MLICGTSPFVCLFYLCFFMLSPFSWQFLPPSLELTLGPGAVLWIHVGSGRWLADCRLEIWQRCAPPPAWGVY